jgi:hypothetical protein
MEAMAFREFETYSNSFLLFGKHVQMVLKESGLHVDAATLSIISSKLWARQPSPVRAGWKKQLQANKQLRSCGEHSPARERQNETSSHEEDRCSDGTFIRYVHTES